MKIAKLSSEDIMETPGIESTGDILQRQGGFYTPQFAEKVSIGSGININPKDPSLKGINIRGSRGGDALILIDGFLLKHFAFLPRLNNPKYPYLTDVLIL